MLDEVCGYLNNYFERNIYSGEFVIKDGYIKYLSGKALPVVPRQYIRIRGSIFNDGIYQYAQEPNKALTDEIFKGSVWALAIPKEVVDISGEIDIWKEIYEKPDSAAMSPFGGENFDVYGYTKSVATGAAGEVTGWQAVFKSKLSRWRKI